MKESAISLTTTTRAILFLFPIGLTTVRHWSSGFFVLLCLLAIFYFRRNITSIKLFREEKTVLLLMALFFFSFLLSFRANNWDSLHIRFIEDEIRFLLFIPLYFLLKNTGDLIRPLVKGSVLSILLVFWIACYEIYIMDLPRATGAYSSLLLGPVTSIMVFFIINSYHLIKDSKFWANLSLISIPFGLYAAYLSTTRSAYILIVTLSVTTIFLLLNNSKIKISIFALLICALFLSYQYAPRVTYGVDRVVVAFDEIISADNISNLDMDIHGKGASTKQRIALWHAAYQIFSVNVLFGVGRGGYPYVVKQYVDTGQVNPVAATHGHPHNIFIESMVSKGVIGLSILLSLFVYLFYRLFVHFRKGVYASNSMIIVVVAFFVAGLFESSPIIKGNYIAFVLVYLACTVCDTVRESESDKIIE